MASPSFEHVLLDRTGTDADVRVPIVRGAGRTFSAGYDGTVVTRS